MPPSTPRRIRRPTSLPTVRAACLAMASSMPCRRFVPHRRSLTASPTPDDAGTVSGLLIAPRLINMQGETSGIGSGIAVSLSPAAIAGILAVAFSTLLVTMQCGVLLGLLSLTSLPVDQTSADVWVGHPVVLSVDLGRPIPERWHARVAQDPGVLRPEDLLLAFLVVDNPGGRSELCTVIGSRLDEDAMGAARPLTPELRVALSLREYHDARGKLDEEEASLAALRGALDQESADSAAREAELRRLEGELGRLDSAIRAQEAELAAARQQIAGEEATQARERAAAEEVEQDLAGTRARLTELMRHVAAR